MCIVVINEEKQGIEVRFESKPSAETLESLKENGFCWSGKQKMWYAKQTDERMAFIGKLDSNFVENNAEKCAANTHPRLFALTRVDQIECNINKSLTVKEIAALIRDHMKKRFPMCKISVRSRKHNSTSRFTRFAGTERNATVC